MVYRRGITHTIYGVIALTKALHTGDALKLRTNSLNFLLFVTGTAFGCLCSRFFGTASGSEVQTILAGGSFLSSLLGCGRFLILLYLFAFIPGGAVLVPPLFGAEGAFLGGAISAAAMAMGAKGAVLFSVLLLFRLVLVVPYGFLLGAWSVGKCLRFPDRNAARQPVQILCMTACVIAAAAFLECTVAHWLGGIYYLKFGVCGV